MIGIPCNNRLPTYLKILVDFVIWHTYPATLDKKVDE